MRSRFRSLNTVLMIMVWAMLFGCTEIQKPASLPTPTPINLPTQVINSTAQDDELVLDLETDKSEYSSNDPIQAIATIRYTGPLLVLVNVRFAPSFEIAFCVFDEQGNEIDGKASSMNPIGLSPHFFAWLSPVTSISYVNPNIRDRFNLVNPGTYSLEATYMNNFDPNDGTIAWKGKIVSNRVDFTIVP